MTKRRDVCRFVIRHTDFVIHEKQDYSEELDMSLIVTGSIGIDTVETPTGKAEQALGGSSIYFSAAASYFGPVRLVGAVGEDFPRDYIKEFTHFGVDTAGLEIRKGSKTFRWHGRYHENMNKRDTISVELNVLIEQLPPIPQAYKDSEYVFLAVTAPQNQLALLEQFPRKKIVVADTIDFYINSERPALEKVLRAVDGLIINDDEAALLTGKTDAVASADALLAKGPKFVVVKKGEHGAILNHKQGTVSLPAMPSRNVIDPTGAGDSFAGGFMGYLSANKASGDDFTALRRALAHGTVVASYTIEDFSVGRLKTLKRAELDQRFADYKAMLAIG
jgi:sugar/nucleoside kinase (ribokinase family)